MHEEFVRTDFWSLIGHLVEECGEVQTCLGKILRFGPESVNPLIPKEEQESNIDALMREIVDMENVVNLLKELVR